VAKPAAKGEREMKRGGSKAGPIPKPEGRKPKAERNPNSEGKNPEPPRWSSNLSNQFTLGFRVSAFFRPSAFDLRI
jgi:hypothetical protein